MATAPTRRYRATITVGDTVASILVVAVNAAAARAEVARQRIQISVPSDEELLKHGQEGSGPFFEIVGRKQS